MSSYGFSPYGDELGPFGGPGLITVHGVLPDTMNGFIVVFDRIPDTSDPLAYYSATRPENFTLTPVDPTYSSSTTPSYIPKGGVVPNRSPSVVLAVPDDDDPKQVLLGTDAKLEPGVTYSLSVSVSIEGSDGETFAGPASFTFVAPLLPKQLIREERREQRYRDFAYEILSETPGYEFDASGDLAIQDANKSLIKRIYRRIFSRPGDFAWTTNYGASIQVKALLKFGDTIDAAQAIREQILMEPDVKDAGVSVRMLRQATGTFLEITAKVIRTDGTAVPVRLTGPA